jgi:hypothetical protein
MRYLILLSILLLASCGATPLSKDSGTQYMMVSQACASFVQALITGDACIWKMTNTDSKVKWDFTATGKDEWTVISTPSEE